MNEKIPFCLSNFVNQFCRFAKNEPDEIADSGEPAFIPQSEFSHW
jgi:hypothetical protein